MSRGCRRCSGLAGREVAPPERQRGERMEEAIGAMVGVVFMLVYP